jgi:hypothetical protein
MKHYLLSTDKYQISQKCYSLTRLSILSLRLVVFWLEKLSVWQLFGRIYRWLDWDKLIPDILEYGNVK